MLGGDGGLLPGLDPIDNENGIGLELPLFGGVVEPALIGLAGFAVGDTGVEFEDTVP